jgi:hypothetical protein
LFRPQQAHLQLLSELAAVGEQYATSDISAQRNLASEIATLSHTIGAGILTNDQNEPFFFAAVEAPEPSNVIGALRHQFDVDPLEGTDNSHTIKIPSGSPVGHLRIIDKVIFLTTEAGNLDSLAASWNTPPSGSRNTPVDAVLQHGWITPKALNKSVEQLLTEPPQGMVEMVSQLSKHLDHLSIGQTISSGQQRVYLRLHPYSQQAEGQLSDLPAPAGMSGQE